MPKLLSTGEQSITEWNTMFVLEIFNIFSYLKAGLVMAMPFRVEFSIHELPQAFNSKDMESIWC